MSVGAFQLVHTVVLPSKNTFFSVISGNVEGKIKGRSLKKSIKCHSHLTKGLTSNHERLVPKGHRYASHSHKFLKYQHLCVQETLSDTSSTTQLNKIIFGGVMRHWQFLNVVEEFCWSTTRSKSSVKSSRIQEVC